MDTTLEALSQFHFLRPWWLLMLIPAGILGFALLKKKAQFGQWKNLIAPHLIAVLLDQQTGRTSHIPVYLLSLAWFIATLALAGPAWEQRPQPVEQKIDARVIVLDLSQSMNAPDITPTRISRIRHKLSDILERSEEGLTALLVYSGDPHIVTPLTSDTDTITTFIPSLTPEIMPLAGNNPLLALREAKKLLSQSGKLTGEILLITDHVPSTQTDDIERLLKGTSYTLSIYGIGTLEGAPIALPGGSFAKNEQGTIIIPQLKREQLRSLANTNGGRYTELTVNDEDIDYLLRPTLLNQPGTTKTERTFDLWNEEGPWLVLLLLPLAALGFRKGWLMSFAIVPLLGLAPPQVSHASLWEDLWQTRDQQAAKAFGAGDYQNAQDTFNTPDWKAAAYYKNEHYQEAVETLENIDQPDAHYNRANALAKLNKLEDAIKAYDQALERAPDHSDAKANRKLIEELLKQQQQQGKKNQDQDKKQDSQQQDSQQQQQDSQQGEGEKESEQSQKNQTDEQQRQDQQQNSQQQNKQEPQESQQKESEKQNSEQQGSRQQNAEKDEQREQKEQEPSQSLEEQEAEKQDKQEVAATKGEPHDISEEQKEAMDQWLRRVPDNPGNLLKRKFQYNTYQRLKEQRQ